MQNRPTCPTMSLQMRVMAMTSHSIQNDSADSRGMIMLLDVACIYDRVRDLLLRYSIIWYNSASSCSESMHLIERPSLYTKSMLQCPGCPGLLK